MMATNRTLLEQARELQALAQTGLMYCKDPFDRERDGGRHALHAG